MVEWGKRRFLTILTFFAMLISVLVNPNALAAPDHFYAKLPDFRAQEVLIAERVAAEKMEAKTNTDDKTENQGASAKESLLAGVNQVLSVTRANTTVGSPFTGDKNIASLETSGQAGATSVQATMGANDSGSVVNYRVSIVLNSASQYMAASQQPSYNDIYRYQRLIFAHNTAGLLGNLVNLRIGTVFMVTENGVSRQYQVTSVNRYPNTTEGLNGDPKMITKLARGDFGQDLALITCAGTVYANGDASERLVVLAQAL